VEKEIYDEMARNLEGQCVWMEKNENGGSPEDNGIHN
jgi:hypothetical protein